MITNCFMFMQYLYFSNFYFNLQYFKFKQFDINKVRLIYDYQSSKMEKQLNINDIVNILRTVKKTDLLFKPLKKLKSALEKIDVNQISMEPTSQIIIFHFGLGIQTDWQIISSLFLQQKPKNTLLPGKSYCILQFSHQNYAISYTNQMQTLIQNVFYYNVENRIIIAIYWKGKILQIQQNIPNCDIQYHSKIPGLTIKSNILSIQQESIIIKQIDLAPWNKLNNRRVQHYGFQFKYGKNGIDKDNQNQNPLPKWTLIIQEKIEKQFPYIFKQNGGMFDQLTINDYFAGDGIPAHFDTHSPFQQHFVSVSLLSGIVMELCKFDGEEQNVFLSPRSICIFSGQARYAWTHGITCRKIDKIDGHLIHRNRRVSLTFRKIRRQPCICKYYFYCDSQGYDQNTMKKNNWLLEKYLHWGKNEKLTKLSQKEVQKKYVYQAYNGFGHNFDNQYIQGIQKMISEEVKMGDLVLDIGCGNGTYRNILTSSYYIGIEKCKTMKGSEEEERLFMDGLKLGFRRGCFDSVLLVAVLHHFASFENRLKCLTEIREVISDEGILYMSIFSFKQKQQIYGNQDILLDYCLPNHKIKDNIVESKQIPKITSKGEIYSRYYHLFTEQQVEKLLHDAGFKIVLLQCDKQNIIVKAKKII